MAGNTDFPSAHDFVKDWMRDYGVVFSDPGVPLSEQGAEPQGLLFDQTAFGRMVSKDSIAADSSRGCAYSGSAGPSERMRVSVPDSMAVVRDANDSRYSFYMPDTASATGVSEVFCRPGSYGTESGRSQDGQRAITITIGENDSYQVSRPQADGSEDYFDASGSQVGEIYEDAKQAAVKAAHPKRGLPDISGIQDVSAGKDFQVGE